MDDCGDLPVSAPEGARVAFPNLESHLLEDPSVRLGLICGGVPGTVQTPQQHRTLAWYFACFLWQLDEQVSRGRCIKVRPAHVVGHKTCWPLSI